MTAAEVAREQQRDPVLRRVYQYTRCGWRHTSDPVLEPLKHCLLVHRVEVGVEIRTYTIGLTLYQNPRAAYVLASLEN